MFRTVFMGCLVVFSKRSYLGSCTLDNGTTIRNPNCGQRVADDYARVPQNAGWFFTLPATVVILCKPAVSPGHWFLPDQGRQRSFHVDVSFLFL